MAMGGKQLLALDWNRRDLRMVVVRPRADGVDLLKAASVPIPADVRVEDPEAFGAFIREAMKQSKVGVKKALLCIPRDQVVLNTLNLPPTPSEEMPAIVQFQIVKELPFSAEQAALDFAVCGEFDAKAPSSVLVAAVRKDDLDHYTKVASQAGLSVTQVGLRPFSNLIAVTANNPDLVTKNVLVVEVGPQLTEIDILKRGVLAFSRSASVSVAAFGAGATEELKDSRIVGLNVPDREPDEASAQSVSAMMVEIIRSYEAYRATDPSLGLDHIIVCGSSGIEPQLAQALAARFATRTELFAPEKALSLPAQRARELRGFSAAVGLAVGHGLTGLEQFDFLHPKKPVTKRQLRMKKVPVMVATAVLFIGAAFMFHMRFIAPKQQVVEELLDEISLKKKQERQIIDFKNKVDALEEWIDSEQYWPEVLVALTENFPDQKEAYATRIDLETRSAGRSKGRESVARLKFRTVSLGTVNTVAEKLGEAGFVNVVPGRETSAGSQDVYSKDTGIETRLPDRSTFMAARETMIDDTPAALDEPMPTGGATDQPAAESTGAPAADTGTSAEPKPTAVTSTPPTNGATTPNPPSSATPAVTNPNKPNSTGRRIRPNPRSHRAGNRRSGGSGAKPGGQP